VIGFAQIIILLIPVMMVASAASLVVRFRRSSGVERQQIKWLAAAAAAVAATYLVAMVASLLTPAAVSGSRWVSALQNLALLSFGLIPVAIGIPVLRYRLYEIDVIIRKTLAYAVLIGALALVYLGGISSIGWVLRDVAGQSSTLAVTLSTLAVAAAFQPLRHRIQQAVDRRFYRESYDAQRTLDALKRTTPRARRPRLAATGGARRRPRHAPTGPRHPLAPATPREQPLSVSRCRVFDRRIVTIDTPGRKLRRGLR
jgi:hypothetical protein